MFRSICLLTIAFVATHASAAGLVCILEGDDLGYTKPFVKITTLNTFERFDFDEDVKGYKVIGKGQASKEDEQGYISLEILDPQGKKVGALAAPISSSTMKVNFFPENKSPLEVSCVIN